jgi:ubiquinone biosynthesis protein
LKTVIHLARFKQIVVTLFKYGFNDLVELLELPGREFLEKLHPTDPNVSKWERARLALEELGPTFVKIGQMISQRPDIAPPQLVAELQKLQEQVKPVGYPLIRRVVEANFGVLLEDLFSEFETAPRAAASLAQVHRAVLRDGAREVAVKVQRPGIRDRIDTDLDILEAIARRVHERVESARSYDLPGFVRELRSMRIFQGYFQGSAEIYIPEAYEEYCTGQVLTMELVRGRKLAEFMDHGAGEREFLAKRGVRLTIRQMLEFGFFHADPHPGNVVILDDLVFCLFDFGMMGRLSEETRRHLIDLMQAMVESDSEKLLDAVLRLSGGGFGGVAAERALEREILEILDVYHSVVLKRLHLGRLMSDILEMFRENGLRLPSDLALMMKALITIEGTARLLYPELDVLAEASPYVRRLAEERWRPGSVWHSLHRTLYSLFEFQKRLPWKLGHIVDLLDRGELNIRFQHENLGAFLRTLETVATRLVSAVIIASLILSSSHLIGSDIRGLPALGIVGYVISALLGLWLVATTLFKHKP